MCSETMLRQKRIYACDRQIPHCRHYLLNIHCLMKIILEILLIMPITFTCVVTFCRNIYRVLLSRSHITFEVETKDAIVDVTAV